MSPDMKKAVRAAAECLGVCARKAIEDEYRVSGIRSVRVSQARWAGVVALSRVRQECMVDIAMRERMFADRGRPMQLVRDREGDRDSAAVRAALEALGALDAGPAVSSVSAVKPLSSREIVELRSLLDDGLSAHEIAKSLGRARKTVMDKIDEIRGFAVREPSEPRRVAKPEYYQSRSERSPSLPKPGADLSRRFGRPASSWIDEVGAV